MVRKPFHVGANGMLASSQSKVIEKDGKNAGLLVALFSIPLSDVHDQAPYTDAYQDSHGDIREPSKEIKPREGIQDAEKQNDPKAQISNTAQAWIDPHLCIKCLPC